MGKHWSKQEHAYFTKHVLPKSHYATGKYSENGVDFGTLAIQMQADMDKKNQTRRQYTEDILWQHYYQKVRNGAKSHTNSATFAPSFPGNPATQHRDEREVPMAQEPTSQSATGIEGHIGEKGRSALRNSPLSAEEFTMDPSPSSAAEVDSSSKNPLTTSSLVPRINTFVEGSSDTSTHQSLPIPHTSSATLNISPSTTIPLHPSTSNTMASSESQVALGGEDASANNPKRTLEDEADNGELATQNAAKKYKTVKYNLGDVPELGSDPVSPSPAEKKTKGKVSKVAAKKKPSNAGGETSVIPKATTAAGRRKAASKAAKSDANDSPGAAGSPTLATGGPTMSAASMFKHRLGPYAPGAELDPDRADSQELGGLYDGIRGRARTRGGASLRARGRGPQRSRHPFDDATSSPAYDEHDSEEGFFDNAEYQHHPQAPQHPFIQQYRIDGPTYDSSYASSYGESGRYQSPAWAVELRRRRSENLAFNTNPPYPLGAYPGYRSLPREYPSQGMNLNTPPSGPTFQPYPTSAQPMAPGAVNSRPTLIYGVSSAEVVGQRRPIPADPSAMARPPTPLDLNLAQAHRPTSSTSNPSTLTQTNNQAPALSIQSDNAAVNDTGDNDQRPLGTIHFDNGATTYQVTTCPCCRRGF